MTTGNHVAHALAVFRGFDQDEHTLPGPLVEARANYHRVAVALADVELAAVADPYEAERDAALAFARGETLDINPAHLAHAEATHRDVTIRVLTEAAEVAGTSLSTTLRDLGDEVVIEHLAPRLAEIVAAFATTSAVYRVHGVHEKTLMHAPQKARDAFAAGKRLAHSYAVVAAALAALRNALRDYPDHDYRGYFAGIHNTEQVWPEILLNIVPKNAPWPTDAMPFLHWAIDHGAHLWCPTVEQQEARWWDVFGERAERAQSRRQLEQAV